jgi:hypothetical protein
VPLLKKVDSKTSNRMDEKESINKKATANGELHG